MQPSVVKNGLDLAARLRAVINKKSAPTPPPVMPSPAGDVHQKTDVRPTPGHDVRGDVRPHPSNMSEIMLAAINNVKKTVPIDQHVKINTLYQCWIDDLQKSKDDYMLTARGSISWVKTNAAKALHINVSYAAIDAISNLFRTKALAAGAIEHNPDYTGKPPFPRYRRRIQFGDDV